MVCALVALSCVGTGADRNVVSDDIKSVHLTRDGHFQLAADAREDLPPVLDAANVPVNVPALHQIEAHHPVERHEVDELITDARNASDQKADWTSSRQQKPAAAPTSFADRTVNALAPSSHMASGDPPVGSQASTPQLTVPPNRYDRKPPGWPMTAWNKIMEVQQQLKPLREGPGSIVATGAALALGPDSCILKIAYVFFKKDGEDDYPYIPRGCGDMFDFALNANSIPVPWMLIVGSILIVTGTHSSADTIQ